MIDAIRNNDERMIRLLLEKGALVDVTGKNASSPLRAATVRGHERTVRLLIEHGANLDNCYLLIEAVRRGHQDIIKLLIEKGADVNAVQCFDYIDEVPFWRYTIPNTSRLADLRRKLDSVSNLRLRPKIRHPSKPSVLLIPSQREMSWYISPKMVQNTPSTW